MPLTSDQTRFFELLEQFPRIRNHWGKEKAELDLDLFEKDLSVMSSSERVIACWLAGLWLGENKYGFDVIGHLNSMGQEGSIAFRVWVNDPFFP